MSEQEADRQKVKGLSEAFNFACDVQLALEEKGACMKDQAALKEVFEKILPNYPDCVISDVITFGDGSVAALAQDGIIVK